MRYQLSLFICALSLLASCIKRSIPQTGADVTAHYYFVNKINKPVIVRVGDSLADNPFYIEVAANSSATIPSSKLMNGNMPRNLSYYWATKDFSMSSWALNSIQEIKNTSSFSYTKSRTDYAMVIEPVQENHRMQYYLNGIDGPTTWKAIDAFDANGNSVWNTLGVTGKTHTLTFTYLQTATHDRINYIGAPIRDYMFFHYDQRYPGDVFIASHNYSSADTSLSPNYSIICNNRMDNYKLSTNATDTLFMQINSSLPVYKLAKMPQQKLVAASVK